MLPEAVLTGILEGLQMQRKVTRRKRRCTPTRGLGLVESIGWSRQLRMGASSWSWLPGPEFPQLLYGEDNTRASLGFFNSSFASITLKSYV